MPRNPIPEEFHDRFRELHALGYGRNRIARELEFPPVQISRTAEYLGLTFDRSRIQEATKARLADLEERRAIIAEDFTDAAEKALKQMSKPHLYWDWGGKDHDFDTYEAAEPTPADKRALMSTAATAIDRSLKLVPVEGASNLDSAKSMLGSLGEALAAFSRSEDEREETEQAAGDGEA